MIQLTKSFDNQLDGLGSNERKAVTAALEAVKNSYSPYSNFKVGAALLLENGEVVLGSNQENAAYPSGLCAERAALFTYGSAGRSSKISILAIVSFNEKDEQTGTCSPCGGCRQVMLEYEQIQQQPYKVIFCFEGKIEVLESSAALLPYAFHF